MVKIKKTIIDKLLKEGLVVNALKIRGYNKETGNIKNVQITVEDYDIGGNAAYIINRILEEVEDEFNVMFNSKWLDL